MSGVTAPSLDALDLSPDYERVADLQTVSEVRRDALDRRRDRWRVVQELRFLFHTDRTRLMTEAQTEYETDVEPTPGPWELTRTHSGAGEVVVGGSTGFVATPWRTPKGEAQMMANARLIAAAGTAAQEAKEMGYDPQKVVEALPRGLGAVRKAIIDLQEAHTSGLPEDSAEAAAQAASQRLKVFMAESGADETMIPGDASVALASAEGSDDE